MSAVHQVATWIGYCPRCADDCPLTLLQTGPRGLRAWLDGHGDEDRSLSLACRLCGHVEAVPATEAEDWKYDASLPRWPDPLPVRRPGAPWPSDVTLGAVDGVRQVVVAAVEPPTERWHATEDFAYAS